MAIFAAGWGLLGMKGDADIVYAAAAFWIVYHLLGCTLLWIQEKKAIRDVLSGVSGSISPNTLSVTDGDRVEVRF
jgi:hypothetical protein